MSTSKIKHITFISLLTLGLTACGGGGGGSGPKINSGVFKDSPTKGLLFVSGGQSGTTGKNGEFKYEAGKDISFSAGAIKLGTTKGKSIITPVDLVSGATPEMLSKKGEPSKTLIEVVNRVRFLLLLDKDNDPNKDGIEISNEVQKKLKELSGKKKDIDFKKSVDDFENELGYVNGVVDNIHVSRDVRSFEYAKSHLKNTLKVIENNKRCTDSGAFTGTYSGTESGNIAVILDPSTGKLKGTIFNTDKSGNFVPRETIKLTLSGGLSDNTLKGKWVDSLDKEKSGDFTADRIAGNSGANKRYSAIYDTSQGILAIDVKSKNVTGILYDVETGIKLKIVSGKLVNKGNYDTFENVKLSNEADITTSVITETFMKGVIIESATKISDFEGTGCKLN